MGDRAFFAIIILLLALTGGYFFLMKHSQAPGDSTTPGLIATDAEVEAFVRHDFAKALTIESSQTDDQRIEQATPYMTEAGLEDLRRDFLQSDWMKSTEATEVSFLNDPKVTEKNNGVWTVNCMIDVDFTGGGAKRDQAFNVTLKITDKDLNGEKTFGIDDMTLTPAVTTDVD